MTERNLEKSIQSRKAQDSSLEQAQIYTDRAENTTSSSATYPKIFIVFLLIMALFIVGANFYMVQTQIIAQSNDSREQLFQSAAKLEGTSNQIKAQVYKIQQKLGAQISDNKDQMAALNQFSAQQSQRVDKSLSNLSQQLKKLRAEMNQAKDNIKKEFEEIDKLKQQISQNKNQIQLISINNPNDKSKSIEKKQVKKEQKIQEAQPKERNFNVPKKLWIFKEGNRSYLNELCFKNNINFSKESGFQAIEVTEDNYKNYLNQKVVDSLGKILKMLNERVKSGEGGTLKDHLGSITRKMILLNILNENGGIITNGEFAMTQNLNWLVNIADNPYVNRGDREANPQVFGYYSVQKSISKEKYNFKPFKGMVEVDQYLVLYPSLQTYFISAYKGTEFINKLIITFYDLLSRPAEYKANKQKYKFTFKGEDIYGEYFQIGSQIVLQDKQKELDEMKSDSYRTLAIDYYGLRVINNYYGPFKMMLIWYNDYRHKPFECLTRYTQEELLASIGHIKYIAQITPTNQINRFLEEARDKKRMPILEGSFIHKIFYSHQIVNFTMKNTERPFKNETNIQWNTLPKTIWIFWDQGLANAKINNKICWQNLKKMGEQAGFKVVQVNMANIGEYLDSATLAKIQNSISLSKLTTFPTTRSDLVRLAIIHKYGGIYMDSSYIALESFEWILNIGRYPSQFIFNRFGELPKVFMIWHPYDGSPREWTISQKYNTKSQWHLGYENSFIAAQKESELIKEWFQLLLQLYLKPYNQIQKIFSDCMMASAKWSKPWEHYLIPMDAVKCVIGRRQVQIEKDKPMKWQSASDYYRIWSISGYLGQQKFAWNTNYQRPGKFDTPGIHDNVYVYRHSQEYSQGLVGKVRFLVKFFSRNNVQMSNFVGRHMDGNFSSQAHPQSIFMKYMWNPRYKLEGNSQSPKLKILT